MLNNDYALITNFITTIMLYLTKCVMTSIINGLKCTEFQNVCSQRCWATPECRRPRQQQRSWM